jgi:23S rRNA pseudouridine2605 synthase
VSVSDLTAPPKRPRAHAARGCAENTERGPRTGADRSVGADRIGTDSARYGLARVLSKRGLCSRTQAEVWIREGRVRVGGRVVRNPESPTALDRDDIVVDHAHLAATTPIYLMLNKPRGLIVSTHDERGRETVYRCFEGAMLDGAPLPWIAPVGRLDKASEGLLLFSNDPMWAARIADPETGPSKTYHVHIDRIPDAALFAALDAGVDVDIDGRRTHLAAVSARLLRSGEKHAWIEIVLDEGRNRQIRRLLAAFDIAVLRLVRVAIGGLTLGELPKGQWRSLSADELQALGPFA